MEVCESIFPILLLTYQQGVEGKAFDILPCIEIKEIVNEIQPR